MKRFALFALSLSLVSSGCRRPPAPKASPAAPASGAGDVMAQVDGTAITRGELDEKVDKRLLRLRQEEYEIRRDALDEMIGERLIEKEAKARGISRDELLRDAVDNQVKEPDAKVIDSVYEQNKARFAGKSRDQMIGEIRKAFRERARGERLAEFRSQLRKKASVQVALEAPRTQVPIPASAPTLGPNGAAVTIVEFSDYQCPYCHRAQSAIDQVMKTYAGKVQLVHRDFPLDGHPGAFPAARASRCAGEQGKFWDYHHSLMTETGPLDDDDLRSRAARLKLEATAFGTCLSSDRHDASIRESVEAGTKAGVNGTPAYFVNGRALSGALPFETFREIVEAELRGSR
jgi:protein-disulfide isomerase